MRESLRFQRLIEALVRAAVAEPLEELVLGDGGVHGVIAAPAVEIVGR
jgi:hypothetical protein